MCTSARELAVLLALLGAACGNRSPRGATAMGSAAAEAADGGDGARSSAPRTAAPAPEDGAGDAGGAAAGWQERYDLTGDGVRDRLEVTFTGGAHCCYTLALVDGGSGVRTTLPFELDGGYPHGLDLSQPERFAITEAPGRPPRLELEIETYDGVPGPLPADGFGLGVTSHRVAVSFAPGARAPQIENLGWSCARALAVLQRGAWAAWEGLAADCELDAVLGALGAVPLGDKLVRLGRARRPATAHHAERTEDGVLVVAYTARPEGSGGALPRAATPAPPTGTPAKPTALLRIDLRSPLLAARAAAPAAGAASVHGPWRYWSRGLAVHTAPPSGPPTLLVLVPPGELATFLRDLATP